MNLGRRWRKFSKMTMIKDKYQSQYNRLLKWNQALRAAETF